METNLIKSTTTCNEIILKTIQPLIYEINLNIQIQEEESILLGFGPNPRALALWVNSVLNQGNAHSQYQNKKLHHNVFHKSWTQKWLVFLQQKFES